MLPNQYESNQLILIIESLLSQKSTGNISLKTEVSSWQAQRSCTLILRKGELVFGDIQVPTSEQFCEQLGKKINPNSINAALAIAKKRSQSTGTEQDLIEILVTLKVFTWEDIGRFITSRAMVNLEIFSTFPGTIEWQKTMILLFLVKKSNRILIGKVLRINSQKESRCGTVLSQQFLRWIIFQ